MYILCYKYIVLRMNTANISITTYIVSLFDSMKYIGPDV